jgi:PAS domain S-box-containing protein
MNAHGQALRPRSQQDIAEALRRLPAPAFVFEVPTGCFLDANDRFETLVGYTRPELLNMMVEAIQPDDHVASCHEARRQAPPQGLLRWQYCRKDGTLINVKVHYREVHYKRDSGETTNARLVVVEFWQPSATA